MSNQKPTPSERLRQLGLRLPATPPPAGKYLPGVRSGQLVFVSGQTPSVDGRLVLTGYVGEDVSVDQARQGARLAALNCLAQLVAVTGSLERVRRIVRVTGYVRSAPGFVDQPAVVNGASELLIDLWGEEGQHARTSVGVAELPGGAPVEVELIVEVEP
jgi:enamine deaminase RidA (YjgF/YER057c/UK114 family)